MSPIASRGEDRQHGSRGVSIGACVLGVCLVLPLVVFAVSPPAWWQQRGAINGNPSDDYAAANIGQVKHIAAKAFDEFQAKLPGGAGPVLTALMAKWTAPPEQQTPPGVPRDDYAAINLGQLKAIAKPFYDRLSEAHFRLFYPWDLSSTPPDDSATANLGQVKFIFSFDFDKPVDADSDGLPDVWEIHNGLSPLSPDDGLLDYDGDGVSNAQEFLNGTDPLVNPNAPPSSIPLAPQNVTEWYDNEGGRHISWDDVSNNETYFVIRDYLPGGSVVELGRTRADQTHLYIPPGL